MKVSVIGNGSIGRRHLRNCNLIGSELGITELRGFDTNPQRRAQAKEEVKDLVVATSLAEAVRGADIVFMCVPTSLHISVLQEMGAAGQHHLFIEKPLSHTLAGCEQLVFGMERAGKVLHVGYVLHHHPLLKKVKEILDSGTLGRVLSVRAEAGFYLPYWHPWEDYRDFYMSWKSGGGGALLDISHEINYLQWMFGDIDEVKGFVDTVSDLEITSDDIAIAILLFKSGIYGQFHLDLMQFDESRYCKIIGTEGVLIGDLTKNTIRTSKRDVKDWSETRFDVKFDDIYFDQLRAFFAACRGKGGAIVSGRESIKTMEVVEAVRRSHAYSTSVRLPLYD